MPKKKINKPVEVEAPKQKPYLSPSQIASYTRCGEAYRRRYINKEIIPPRIVMVKGTAIHKGAELNFQQKITTGRDLPKSQIIDKSVSVFEDTIKHEGVWLNVNEEAEGKDISISKQKDSVAAVAGVFVDHVAPKYQPKMVEYEQLVEIEGGSHNLKGIIDLEDVKERLIDFKITSKTMTQAEVDNSFQLTFYAMLKRSKTGNDPSDIIIEDIVDQVRQTKVGTISTKRTMDDYRAAIARINMVADAINKGIYAPANDKAWWCAKDYCGYYLTCAYVNGKRT